MDKTTEVTQKTKSEGPVFRYVKLHTPVRIPGVTQQTGTTIDHKEFKNFSLEIVGSFLKITAAKPTTPTGVTYTPLANVVCLCES